MISLSVQNVTTNAGFVGGTIALQRQLSATSRFSLLQGSDAALALGSDSLTLSAALAIGETVTALVAETDGSGASFRQIAYALNITGAVSSSDVYHLVMLRGADTKPGAGAVNMGSFLFERGFIDAPFNATSTQFTWRSGTSTHLTLTTDGRSPTPSAAGNAARLNGGDYVLDFTAVGDGRTVSGTLTIKRELGRSLPAYSIDRGAISRAAETFTTACFSVSSEAELQALTASNLSGAAVLLSLGAAKPFGVWPGYGKRPTNACLIQSEIIAWPTTATRLLLNNNDNFRYDSVKLQASASYITSNHTKSSDTTLVFLALSKNIRISRCRIGAPQGTPVSDLPRIALAPNTGGNLDMIGNSFDLFKTFELRNGDAVHIVRNAFTRFSDDSLILGYGATYNGFIYEGNFITDSVYLANKVHPDTGQLTTNAGLSTFQLYYKWIDNTTFGGASGTSFNGPNFTGDLEAGNEPTFACPVEMSGNFHASLTLYAPGCINNAVLQSGAKYFGTTAVRQLTGVTGNIDQGKASGAQGFDTIGDDGVTRFPINNQRFPGGVPFKPGMLLVDTDSYYDGPAFSGAATSSQVVARNKPNSTTNPVGLQPSDIIDNSAYFDDPNRVIPDWTIYAPAERLAILRDMYAARAGGPLDQGNGRVTGTWCVRRNGAPAKRNQYGTATLSLSAAAGQVTATLSRVLGVDVICDVVRNGAATGVAITIPAGQTSAGGAVALAAGDAILLKNDCGLLNPSVIAA